MSEELRSSIIVTAQSVVLFYRTLRSGGLGASVALALSAEYVRCIFVVSAEQARVAKDVQGERVVFMRPESEAA